VVEIEVPNHQGGKGVLLEKVDGGNRAKGRYPGREVMALMILKREN